MTTISLTVNGRPTLGKPQRIDARGRPPSILLIRPGEPTEELQFSLGLAYVATALRGAGFAVATLSLDLYPMEDIGLVSLLCRSPHKIFGIGGMYGSFNLIIRICRLIRLTVPDAVIVLGGALATSSPEFSLEMTGADIACIGPSEDSLVQLMAALVGGGCIDDVAGLAVREGERTFRTAPRAQHASLASGRASWPAWDLFDTDNYARGPHYYPFGPGDRVLPILTARGCPYHCNFCFQPSPYDTRDLEDVFDEFEFLIDRYKLDGFYIEDDLFMLNRKRVLAFCEGIRRRGIRTRFTCTGRFNIVNSELLEALRDAGCVTIFYGGESADQGTLDQMSKVANVQQMRDGVELTRHFGIFYRVGFMFGQPNETRETLRGTVNFVKEMAVGHFEERFLYGCVPFPATQLYDHCIERGLLSGQRDFYDKFSFKGRVLDQIPVNMTAIHDDDPKRLLDEANAELRVFYNERRGEWLRVFRSSGPAFVGR